MSEISSTQSLSNEVTQGVPTSTTSSQPVQTTSYGQTNLSPQSSGYYTPNFPPTSWWKNPRYKKLALFITPFLFFILIIMCCCLLCLAPVFFPNNVSNFSFSSSESNEESILNENTSEYLFSLRGFEQPSTPDRATNKIAIIDIQGVVSYIPPGLDADFAVNTAHPNNLTINFQLQKALKDPKVKVIILRLNTPGGMADAAPSICEQIKAVNKSKPVYTFIDVEGASLGYLIANCTRYIYSRPFAITASIGVIVHYMDFTGVFTNIGAKYVTITNSQSNQKSQDEIFDPNSEEYKQIQSMLDEVYNYFVETVWAGRSEQSNNKIKSKEELIRYADGRIMSGLQAHQAGLVDQIAELEEVISDVSKKNGLNPNETSIVSYQVRKTFFKSILGLKSDLSNLLNALTNLSESRKLRLLMIRR